MNSALDAAGKSSGDADFELAKSAVKLGWLTEKDVEAALLKQENSPATPLLTLLSLTPEQIQTLKSPTKRPIPSDAAEAMKDPDRKMINYQRQKKLNA